MVMQAMPVPRRDVLPRSRPITPIQPVELAQQRRPFEHARRDRIGFELVRRLLGDRLARQTMRLIGGEHVELYPPGDPQLVDHPEPPAATPPPAHTPLIAH